MKLSKKVLRGIEAEAMRLKKIYEAPNPEVDAMVIGFILITFGSLCIANHYYNKGYRSGMDKVIEIITSDDKEEITNED